MSGAQPQASPSSPPSAGEGALASEERGFGAVLPELLTPECLGLTLDQLGGEGGCGGADPLGIWQPYGLEQHPSQAADWLPVSIGDLLIPGRI